MAERTRHGQATVWVDNVMLRETKIVELQSFFLPTFW